jgi:uncharacterized phage-associated protein
MPFKLDTRKAIEAAATLIRLAPHRLIGRKRLLALLYLADRESLQRTRRPIVGGKLVAMPYGPIHREVYDLLNGGHSDQAEWSKHFGSDAHLVVLRNDPDVSALSRYEVGILNEISQRFMGYDDWDVADATRDFEEYKNRYRDGTSTTIPADELIDAVGLRKKRDAILRDAKQKEHFDDLFTGASQPPKAPKRRPKTAKMTR